MIQNRRRMLWLQLDLPQFQNRLCAIQSDWRRAVLRLDVLTDHKSGEQAFRRVSLFKRIHDDACAHDDDPVRRLHDLFHFMRDKDHGISLLCEITDKLHQRIRLLRRQNSRRFIHDEDPRVHIQRLEDLDLLLHADGQLPHG